jgi:hypothetical protein
MTKLRARDLVRLLREHSRGSAKLCAWLGNTDMQEGNLAFRPGLALARVYDVLSMMYAPLDNGEVPASGMPGRRTPGACPGCLRDDVGGTVEYGAAAPIPPYEATTSALATPCRVD